MTQSHSNSGSNSGVYNHHSHSLTLPSHVLASNEGASSSASTTSTHPNIEIEWKMHSLIDSFIVELLSSIFVSLSVVFSWDWTGQNFALQFIPGITLGLIMLCLKDEDYFFPDGSPLVTCMVWLMGGYLSWMHSCIRLLAHAVGFGFSYWICTMSPIPVMVYHRQYTSEAYFAMETFTTAVEHIALVYVVMPLLPPVNLQGTKFLFPRFKPKAHPDTMAPSNAIIMHAAVIFSTIHWVFWRMLSCEMNPQVLLLLTMLREHQENSGMDIAKSYHSTQDHGAQLYLAQQSDPQAKNAKIDHWAFFVMGFWGNLLGLLISIGYALFFVPRSHKFAMMSKYFYGDHQSSANSHNSSSSSTINKSQNLNKRILGF